MYLMSNAELRKKLIEKIEATEDEQLLREATRLLEIQLGELEKPYTLTEDINTAIDEAKSQIMEGDFLNHKEANKEVDEWFEK